MTAMTCRPSVGDRVRIVRPGEKDDGYEAIVDSVSKTNPDYWSVDVYSIVPGGKSNPYGHGSRWSNIRPKEQCVIVSYGTPKTSTADGVGIRVFWTSDDGVHVVIRMSDVPEGVKRSGGEHFTDGNDATVNAAIVVLKRTLNDSYVGPKHTSVGCDPRTFLVKVKRIDVAHLIGTTAVVPATPAGDRFPHRCPMCGARAYRRLDVIEHESAKGCPVGR